MAKLKEKVFINANVLVKGGSFLTKNIVMNASDEYKEGAKIVDESNNEKTDFRYGEKFKIIIPIQSMKKDGNFNIKVNGKVATKPVL